MAQPDFCATAPDFPPAFDVVALPSDHVASSPAVCHAVHHASDMAAHGAGAGTLIWTKRRDVLDVAVILEPEMELRRAWPVALVTMLALADALGTVGPPEKPVGFVWPDQVRVDGAGVGGVQLRAAPGSVADRIPDWMVTGAAVRLRFPEGIDAPGYIPNRTSLFEEGFGEVEPSTLAASFARHLLHWIGRWLEEGGGPVAEHWLAHAVREGDGDLGLDPETGDLLRRSSSGQPAARRSLAAALATPNWSL